MVIIYIYDTKFRRNYCYKKENPEGNVVNVGLKSLSMAESGFPLLFVSGFYLLYENKDDIDRII